MGEGQEEAERAYVSIQLDRCREFYTGRKYRLALDALGRCLDALERLAAAEFRRACDEALKKG